SNFPWLLRGATGKPKIPVGAFLFIFTCISSYKFSDNFYIFIVRQIKLFVNKINKLKLLNKGF
ncbi:hypothetical protein V7247_06610, partial [Priestia megaterium]|uniref:hypothetical protein n=1 Tax=Priestia megaterium TaxID=1404 RepID=UPI002FFD8036